MNKVWVYGTLDSSDPLKLKGISQTVAVSKNMTDRIGFVPNWNWNVKGLVVLFNQKGSDYEDYEMEAHSPDPVLKTPTEEWRINHNSLKNLSLEPRVVAIFGQYSQNNYEKRLKNWFEKLRWNKGAFGHGIVILFKDKMALKYCYTFAEEMDQRVSNR